MFQPSGPGEKAAGTGDFDAAVAVQYWVGEWTLYDPNNPEPSPLKVPPGKNPCLCSCSVKLETDS